jgi:sugar (pentulose or hexulose) kinase
MAVKETAEIIRGGETTLGIELGSTRIKAVLIDKMHRPLASGGYSWENRLENGVWTYDLAEAEHGLQESYRELCKNVKKQYAVTLSRVGAIGISGMMHGYLAFGKNGELLAPFRTWRSTNAAEAGRFLTGRLGFNIPIRWSVAQLYQSILEKQAHVPHIRYLTTLAGYAHWRLTGKKVLGVGDASGMFPIDSRTDDYDAVMLKTFGELVRPNEYPWTLREILPQVLCAGDDAGVLSEEGAELLDPTGTLCAGIPMAPPEGDAGTGMVATDSVGPRTGNVSAGTSIFAMIVLEKPLSRVYPGIDMVATPSGRPVAMAHSNNCTSDLDAWVRVFREAAGLFGAKPETSEIYDKLYEKSREGDPDCDGVMVYNYLSGEPTTGLSEGRPMVVRKPESRFTLANFMRAQLYSALAALRVGMDILYREGATLDRLMGHGGLFKTPVVGQQYMADAMGFPVSVMETAGEGGPHGMAILAAYRLWRKDGETLEKYLRDRVFQNASIATLQPDRIGMDGFQAFLKAYLNGLAAERAAADSL